MSEHRPSPTPIDYQEWLAAPHTTFDRHRAEHWWAPFEAAPVSEVLEYRAVRDLLGDDAHLRAFLGGYTEQIMRRNPALSEEHIQELGEGSRKALINMEGEAHHSLRARVSRAFTPRSVAEMRPYLGQLCERLAGDLQPGDDFMDIFARELPARGLARLTGIPEDDYERFIAWIDVLEVQLSGPNLTALDQAAADRVLAASRGLRGYCRDLIAERRARPQDDLISRFVHDAEGEVEDAVIVQLIGDLIFAGNDTTRNALGLMVFGLSHHPEIWDSVAADPSLAPAVVEECLRLHSPTPGPVRQACSAFEYRDKEFERHEVTALSTWSANRDEVYWAPNPHEFDPARPHSGQHLTFGHGVHFCLGASLAREEMRAALVALTARMANLRILETPPMHPADGIYGPVSLRLGFEERATR